MSRTIKCLLLSMLVTMLALSIPINVHAQTPSFQCDGVAALTIAFNATGTTLFAKDESIPQPVAGLTRLAALLLISQAVDAGTFSLDTSVSVSAEAAHVPGSTAFIEANEVISARDLYKSAVMINAGDAIYALCEAVFGSLDVCVARINEVLAAIGATAVYTTPLGDGMELSATDITKIACKLSESKAFLSYSNIYMDSITHQQNSKQTELVNPNRLIRDLIGCTGLATSSSSEAGYCGAFSVTRSKTTFICIVLGAKNSAERFTVAKTAVEYAFASYKAVPIAMTGDVVFENQPVSGSMVRSVNLVALADLTLLCLQSEEEPSAVYNMPDKLVAPLIAGEIIGTVDYFSTNGDRLGSLEIGVNETVDAVSFSDYVTLLMKAWN